MRKLAAIEHCKGLMIVVFDDDESIPVPTDLSGDAKVRALMWWLSVQMRDCDFKLKESV